MSSAEENLETSGVLTGVKNFFKEVYTFYFNFEGPTDPKVFKKYPGIFIDNSDIYLHRKLLNSNVSSILKLALKNEVHAISHLPKTEFYLSSCGCVGCTKPKGPTCKRLNSFFDKKYNVPTYLKECSFCGSKFVNDTALTVHFTENDDCAEYFEESKET